VADLSSVAQTKALAAELLAAGQPLHLLVNNAGCLVNPRRVAAALRCARGRLVTPVVAPAVSVALTRSF
jgi:NAD(P)-dependent dehydrogenase (short-subunit alcohol dehydrogenase family)